MGDSFDGIGKSSFALIDTDGLFSMLGLRGDTVFVDLACGRGDYSFAASRFIRENGRVYAVDRWEEGIRILQKGIREREIDSIVPIRADISMGIPLGSRCADVCLLAAVFHDLLNSSTHESTMKEVERVLKKGALLAIVDFKKIDGPPGPPAASKISPEELENLVRPHGFHPQSTREIGRHHYLSLFVHAGS